MLNADTLSSDAKQQQPMQVIELATSKYDLFHVKKI